MLRRIWRCTLKVVLIPVFILLKLVEGICNLAQLLSGWGFLSAWIDYAGNSIWMLGISFRRSK